MVTVAFLIVICTGLAALCINRRHVCRLDGSGDPAQGIVVFVEPVRWLFIIWGFSWFCRGLRRAGGTQRVILFRWSSIAGAILVIPDLVRQVRLDRRAERLTRFIEQLEHDHPDTPINIVGYSTGAYVATEGCKRLAPRGAARRLILLAGSASPSYDWSGLGGNRFVVHSFHSRLDAINIIGPLLFGGNDRRWGPAGGAVAFKHPPAFLTQRPWSWSDIRLGYFGDHFTVTAPAFIARHVAPLLAVG